MLKESNFGLKLRLEKGVLSKDRCSLKHSSFVFPLSCNIWKKEKHWKTILMLDQVEREMLLLFQGLIEMVHWVSSRIKRNNAWITNGKGFIRNFGFKQQLKSHSNHQELH